MRYGMLRRKREFNYLNDLRTQLSTQDTSATCCKQEMYDYSQT